jgi:coenzyme F420-0:L-glutamate ligase
MKLFALKTGMVKTGDSLADVALEAMRKQNLQLEGNDVLAFASKAVSCAEGRTAKLSDVEPSEKAREMAKQYSLQPEFAELILREADAIYGGVEKAVLTLKSGILAPNAGIDNKNAPVGSVVLWPIDPKKTAKNVRGEINQKTGKNVGVLIVDSGLVPLRIGTIGLALAVAGFKPIRDTRGEKDLYGKPLVITRHAVADDLASATHLLMGEAKERTPVVLIRDAPVDYNDGAYGGVDMMMPFKECIFMKPFLERLRDSK